MGVVGGTVLVVAYVPRKRMVEVGSDARRRRGVRMRGRNIVNSVCVGGGGEGWVWVWSKRLSGI